jgi:hypothetical protein
MSEADFRSKRRQKFLTEKYFLLNAKLLAALVTAGSEGIENVRRSGSWTSDVHAGIFKDKLKLLRLHYTAGDPI